MFDLLLEQSRHWTEQPLPLAGVCLLSHLKTSEDNITAAARRILLLSSLHYQFSIGLLWWTICGSDMIATEKLEHNHITSFTFILEMDGSLCDF